MEPQKESTRPDNVVVEGTMYVVSTFKSENLK